MFDNYVKLPLMSPAFAVDPDCYYGGVTSVSGADPSVQKPLRIFPNPARFSTEAVFESRNAFNGRISAFSLGGRLIYSGIINVQPGTNVFSLDVANWQPGPYFLRLEDRATGLAEVVKLTVMR